jgi:hypothetical protein
MIVFGLLVAAGFAGGWVVRSSVDSSRALAVASVSAFYGAMDRGRRLLAMEREHLEDLVAEGRARYETARLRAVHMERQISANDRGVEEGPEASRSVPQGSGNIPPVNVKKTGRAA